MEVIGMGQGGQLPFELNVSAENISNNENNDVVGKSQQDGTIWQNKNQKSIDIKSTKDAVDQANKIFEDTNTHLKFEVYGKFNDIVVQVVDDNTNEVVKEVPPKKLIDMVEKFCELSGFFMDQKA